MRILFVVKEFPHSRVIGGPVIIYNRVKYLSQRHDVSLLAFADGPTREQVSSVAGYCRDLRLVPFPPKRGCLQKAKDLISGPVPPYFMLSYSEEMYEKLRELVHALRYDVVISEYSMVAQYLYRNPDLAGIKRVMSEHECYWLSRRKAFKVNGLNREGLLALYHMKGLKRFEFDMYADADKVLTLTREGKDELLAIRPGLDISVVPHGVDVDTFRPAERKDGPPTVMFLGNYPHEPNRDAAVFFGTRVWPIIKRKVPDARFLAVGRGPTADMRQMAERDPSIRITGEVDDVRPYFCESDVFVCPVRMGGGFRGKVLEAMACGVPVASTALGAEGIPTRPGENILLAEGPDELAGATLSLLEDSDLAGRISRTARELVVEQYSWQKGVEILEEVLEEVVRG
ncbi:MAG: glycosyltransferase [Actinobacteria bacterium]|nr:glycosyltransferase [Actinomycetota bacterium]